MGRTVSNTLFYSHNLAVLRRREHRDASTVLQLPRITGFLLTLRSCFHIRTMYEGHDWVAC
jgi:hypothetical protein